jgi:predicted Holliday junction resolvase-like endonuclease
MLKTLNEEEPLIRINWRKLLKYGKSFVGAIIWTIKKIVETIAKLILKFAILLIRGFLWTYKRVKELIKAIYHALRKFSKKNIKGIWLLLLIVIFLIISLLGLWRGLVYAKGIIHNLKETENMLQKQQQNTLDLFKENEQLKQEIKDKDAKLQSKAQEQAKFARQQWIINNRQLAEEKLPEEVKTAIAQHCNTYGVKDTRLMQCIVYNESGGRDEAVGDNGDAIGVAQYHLATFLGHRRQMGLPQVDLRKDTNASLQAMMFSISRGGIGNWTARTKCM